MDLQNALVVFLVPTLLFGAPFTLMVAKDQIRSGEVTFKNSLEKVKFYSTYFLAFTVFALILMVILFGGYY